MVTLPADLETYYEAAKVEELARQLESQGYEVVNQPLQLSDRRYDLTAIKNGRKVALEVTLRSDLEKNAQRIAELRDKAHQQGFDEFRLVVIDPPHETTVDIEGIDTLLLAYLREHMPAEIIALSSATRIKNVYYVETDSVAIGAQGIHVVGNAVVDVELGSESRNGSDYSIDFPFHFDILLSHDLRIQQVDDLRVDTASFE